LLNDLTRQIAALNKQIEALKARNDALEAAAIASLWNWNGDRPADSNLNDAYRKADMDGFPVKKDATAAPDHSPASPRYVDVLRTHGQCLYSEDGKEFRDLRLRQVLFKGSVIRTGIGSWCDFFIRRTGTTVRLAPESEMKISKLSESIQNGVSAMDTSLELRNGRILTLVRAPAPGSTLEISDATGRCALDGGRLGCWMITAPGPDSADKLSLTPLRVIRQNGTSVVAAGPHSSAKDGATLPLAASAWETMLIHFDELEAETDKAIAEPALPAR